MTDFDDILAKDSIEKSKIFKRNKQYELVRTDAKMVYQNDLNKTISYFPNNILNKFKEDLFDDLITEHMYVSAVIWLE